MGLQQSLLCELYGDVIAPVIYHLTVIEVIMLSRTSTVLHQRIRPRVLPLVRSIIEARMKVPEIFYHDLFLCQNEKALKDFVYSLHTLDACISGSFLMQVLQSSRANPMLCAWVYSDLDVFAIATDPEIHPDPLKYRCIEIQQQKVMERRMRNASDDLQASEILSRIRNSSTLLLLGSKCNKCNETGSKRYGLVCPHCGRHGSINTSKFDHFLCRLANEQTAALEPDELHKLQINTHRVDVDRSEKACTDYHHTSIRYTAELRKSQSLYGKVGQYTHAVPTTIEQWIGNGYDCSDSNAWTYTLPRHECRFPRKYFSPFAPQDANATPARNELVIKPLRREKVEKRGLDIWTPVDIIKNEIATEIQCERKSPIDLGSHCTAKGHEGCTKCDPKCMLPISSISGHHTRELDQKEEYRVIAPAAFVATKYWPDPDNKDVIHLSTDTHFQQMNITTIRHFRDPADPYRILNAAESLRKWVETFDIDICKNLFDGKRLYVNNAKGLLLKRGTIDEESIQDPKQRRATANRTVRYRKRGFEIQSPDPGLIQELSKRIP